MDGPSATDTATAPPTFGEKAVGLSFNPTGDVVVNAVKVSFAELIDKMNDLRKQASNEGKAECIRMYSVAITQLQTAQMWAVKAITYKYD